MEQLRLYSFKPCYKWIITIKTSSPDSLITCFKPYSNWNTFNTIASICSLIVIPVVCFKPYSNWTAFNTSNGDNGVSRFLSFKPCYKWNTFNTWDDLMTLDTRVKF